VLGAGAVSVVFRGWFEAQVLIVLGVLVLWCGGGRAVGISKRGVDRWATTGANGGNSHRLGQVDGIGGVLD